MTLDIAIEPVHQAIAARLSLGAVAGAAERIDNGLSEVAAGGMSTALAVIAVQSRHLSAALLLLHGGVHGARASLHRTILDAQAAADA